jgi:CheY-like chemotaxis protein
MRNKGGSRGGMSPSISSRPLRIFLVENHADTLKYYQMYLKMDGHEVVHARTMKEAYEGIPQADCDVLISDVGLPDGTGWDLLERLQREKLPHPPYAIAVSGYGREEDRARSRAAGFRHHLLKPFDPEVLETMLDEASRERSLQNQPAG